MKFHNELAEQIWKMRRLPDDCPAIDMHGHMDDWAGFYFPRSRPEEMVEDMDRLGVRLLIFSHQDALGCLGNNMSSVEVIRKFPDYFRAYAAINPNYLGTPHDPGSFKVFSDFREAFVGFKVHGSWHQYPYNGEKYRPVWEAADREGLPVLAHTWGGCKFCGESIIEEVAERYPNAKIIAAHSFHNHWEKAIELARKHDNIYLDLCAVLDDRDGAVEAFVNELGSERILFGTDIPWFSFEYYLGAIISANISEVDLRNVLYGSAMKLFSNLPDTLCTYSKTHQTCSK